MHKTIIEKLQLLHMIAILMVQLTVWEMVLK